MDRREFLTAVATVPVLRAAQSASSPHSGRLKQALFTSAFDPQTPFDVMCREAARLGAHGFDAVRAEFWPTMRTFGLAPTLAFPDVTPPPFADGVARPENRDRIEALMHTRIDQCARDGCGTIAVASGQRRGMTDQQGADNCVAFFNRIKSHAEDKQITVCIEIMNKYDRPDQFCDHVEWGVDVCRRVNSPRIKLLFDIYHVQIQDGDICRHLRDTMQWVGHVHTAGVPGRHEIDETQELNYRFIAQTLVDLGYTGYVAHEYTPSPGRDPLESVRRTLEIMHV